MTRTPVFPLPLLPPPSSIPAALRAAGIRFDIYVHTFHLDKITNLRSNEVGVTLNKCEWSELNPRYVITFLNEKDRDSSRTLPLNRPIQ